MIDEFCVVACAEAFRGDGEIIASAFGAIPTLGARLAKATFEPDLMVTDGEALIVENLLPLGTHDKTVGGYLPFRSVFDVVAAGRRHVMMMATQIDRHGNQNISCIGDWHQPKVQLIGVRGGPGNTVNHATSYWIPNHSPRTFVPRVDFISGVGYDHATGEAARFHEIRCVISNLGVFDFETPDHFMRIRSVHPGVTVEEILEQTGFPLVAGDVPETRAPTDDEASLIRDVLDPKGLRKAEVKA